MGLQERGGRREKERNLRAVLAWVRSPVALLSFAAEAVLARVRSSAALLSVAAEAEDVARRRRP